MSTLHLLSAACSPPGGAALLAHGRLQRCTLLTSLRSFRGRPLQPGAQARAAPLAWAAPQPAQRPSWTARHSRGAWRAAALQQLHVDSSGGAAAAGAAAAADRAASTLATWPAIRPGEVHLWWLDPRTVPGEAALSRCADLLTAEELADCDRSAEEVVWRERLLARALVRTVLAGYLAGSPHPRSLTFERSEHGKPRLAGGAGATEGGHRLRFNLTHTPSMIGLAVGAEGLVGLDVEATERRTRGDPMRLAARRFSAREIEDLQACPDDASRAAYFVQLWTLKEAYVKALGRGISAPPGLKSFSFRVGQSPLVVGEAAAAAGEGQEGQEQRPPNVPAAQQEQQQEQEPPKQARPAPLLVQANGSWRSAEHTSCSSGSVDFLTAAPESRRWTFALLQPAPCLVSALCVERGDSGGACSSSDSGNGNGGEQQQQMGGALRLLCFEAAPWESRSEARAIEPQLLALGQYP